MEKVKKINAQFIKLCEFVSIILISLIAILLLVQIISRTLKIGLQWPEEMARFSFVGVVFLGSAIAINHKKHIVITMILDVLPSVVRMIFEMVIQVLVVVFCLFAFRGTLLTIKSAVGVHANSLAWFQYNYLYYFVLVSIGIMILEASLNVIEYANALVARRKGKE
ncbi:MAG: TRAP transporter small permease subunit [Clostridium sp.]|nr:TRAP transporter small permease subunit [Clostridium sp.]